MKRVGSLARAALGAQLAGPGIRLQTGPFVVSLRSPIAPLADAVHRLYADYPLHDADRFADFHIHMARGRGLRRWLRPQVHFDHDGSAPFQPLPIHHAFPMFEWVLNWCVTSRAHGWLIIHAAVVERDGLAVILPAPPGSGKSTLCAALVARGWRLLSDEMTLVRLSDGLVDASPRPVSLKNASIEVMRAFAPEAVFSEVVGDTAKGAVAHMKAPTASIERAGEPARPAWVIFPQWVSAAPARLEPMPRARAFMELAQNAFNYNHLGPAGFDALARLVDGCASYRFRYGALDDALAVFAALPRPAP
ncbi:MAG: HprK-related kinase A [Gammaproteobacteria bacterium]